MKVVEALTGRVVVERLRIASTFHQKLIGLMGDASLQPDEALWIANCRSIHTCFMRIPIDVLFLSETGRIEQMIPEMRPWRVSEVVWSARDTLECYPGTIRRFGLAVGQTLRLVER